MMIITGLTTKAYQLTYLTKAYLSKAVSYTENLTLPYYPPLGVVRR